MRTPRLTIIIPCFNCQSTLDETVDSCYRQGLEASDFEIVMVNDASTDGTLRTIERIASQHPNIRYSSHEKNMGGGATRNTAVSLANSDVILCLDSDDLLADNVLIPMLDDLESRACDGVVFFGSYIFSTDKNVRTKNISGIPEGKAITLDDLLSNRPCGVIENFLYTKKAFYASGGYPTDHHFDTQGFGFRFLATGHTAFVCPQAFFFHRKFAAQESYFERAYSSGEFSIGHYLILREHIDAFSDSLKDIILNYDIFKHTSLENNIMEAVQRRYLADRGPKSTTPSSFQIAENLYRQGEYEGALRTLDAAPADYRNKSFDRERYLFGKKNGRAMTLKDYKNGPSGSNIRPHAYNHLRPPFHRRIVRKTRYLYRKLRNLLG